MNVRLLLKEDQEAVESIMQGHPLQFPPFVIGRYPGRWKDYLTGADMRCRYYVAELQGETVGHAGYIFNPEAGLYEIVGVAVRKGVQRQGVGKALIRAVCDGIRELDQRQLILYTLGHPKNESTLAFYRNLGFELVNHEQDFFREGYHRVTFMYDL